MSETTEFRRGPSRNTVIFGCLSLALMGLAPVVSFGIYTAITSYQEGLLEKRAAEDAAAEAAASEAETEMPAPTR